MWIQGDSSGTTRASLLSVLHWVWGSGTYKMSMRVFVYHMAVYHFNVKAENTMPSLLSFSIAKEFVKHQITDLK